MDLQHRFGSRSVEIVELHPAFAKGGKTFGEPFGLRQILVPDASRRSRAPMTGPRRGESLSFRSSVCAASTELPPSPISKVDPHDTGINQFQYAHLAAGEQDPFGCPADPDRHEIRPAVTGHGDTLMGELSCGIPSPPLIPQVAGANVDKGQRGTGSTTEHL